MVASLIVDLPSHDVTGTVDWGIRLAEGGDHSIAAAFGGAKIDEEHLVFAMVDDLAECLAALGKVDRPELALEDGVLQVVAKAAHGFEDLAEPFVVTDVVADEEGVAHGPPVP